MITSILENTQSLKHTQTDLALVNEQKLIHNLFLINSAIESVWDGNRLFKFFYTMCRTLLDNSSCRNIYMLIYFGRTYSFLSYCIQFISIKNSGIKIILIKKEYIAT